MVEHYYFNISIDGMKKHSKFLIEINKNGYKIINSWVTYHDYSNCHIPKEIHYIIQYK